MIDLKQLVRKNILDLKPYSSARDEFGGSDGIFLDANENPYGDLNRYPDPYQMQLKQVISERSRVLVEKIFLGNGSDEVIDLVFRVFCEPGKDKALTFVPTYGMYQVSAEINNIELTNLNLDDNFEIDLEALQPELADPSLKLILICSPNNPTGNCIAKEVVESILKSFNGIVLVDEAYIDFAPEKSMLALLDQYPNLIVTRTLSKAWGLAAARIGIAFTNSEIVNYLNKVKPPYNISAPNQQAALRALKNTKEYEANLERIREEKRKLQSNLEELEMIKKIYPSEANFILVEVDDANEIYSSLVARKVIIRNRDKQIKNCLRITVGSKEENEELIKYLKELNDEKSTLYR